MIAILRQLLFAWLATVASASDLGTFAAGTDEFPGEVFYDQDNGQRQDPFEMTADAIFGDKVEGNAGPPEKARPPEEDAAALPPQGDSDAADGQDPAQQSADEKGAEIAQEAVDGRAGEGLPKLRQQRPLKKGYQSAYLIEVDGPIFGRFGWYLNNRLEMAQAAGADLVIVQLNSPGGEGELSLELARRLRDIQWADTIVYIPREAISGGAIIAMGADRIYMQDNALIGDAGPITLGQDGLFEHVEEKIVSYYATALRELAVAQGRPAALAEAMVDRSLVLYAAAERDSGIETVLKESEARSPEAKQRFEIGDVLPESGQNRFLTLGAERAKQLGLCEGVFESESDMLASLNLGDIQRTRMNWVDRTVYVLNRPWLTAILLILGLVGLYLELAAPGLSVAGLLSALCFGIFFWSHALGGTSGWLEVLLFILGIVCLICELFVLPGFGVFGIAGVGLVVVSLVMASQSFLVPSTATEWSMLQTNSLVVLGCVLGVFVLLVGQILLLDSLPGLNRFRLPVHEVEAVGEGGWAGSLAAEQSPHVAVAMGDRGVAESDLRPSGKVGIEGVLVDVVTEGDYVDAGSRVQVVRIEGNRVVVRKMTPPG